MYEIALYFIICTGTRDMTAKEIILKPAARVTVEVLLRVEVGAIAGLVARIVL